MKNHREAILLRLLEDTPQEVLETLLDEVDVEALQGVRHELGICVNWGTLVENMYQMLMGGMDTLVFLETEQDDPAVVKRNPYEALFERDQELINGSSGKSTDARKYAMLGILKKLLGALKTKVNKEFESIVVIDDETHGDLKDMIDFGQDIGADEEEMDLVVAQDDDDLTQDPNEITAVIDKECMHRRVTIKQIPSAKTVSRLDELHSFCKDCKRPIEVQQLKSRSTGTSSRNFGKPAPCRHKAIWKEGEEGSVAVCDICDAEIENPGRFEWSSVGLEPFGDKPDDDEISSFVVKDLATTPCEHQTASIEAAAKDGTIAGTCDACGASVDGSLYTVEIDPPADEKPKEMTA